MLAKSDAHKRELLDGVVARIHERLEGTRALLAESFVRHFYANVAPDDLVGESADNLYGAALSIWSQAQTRQPGQAKVRVYNPRPEEEGWKSSHTIVEIINDDMPFLVDSVASELTGLGAEIYLVIHPIIGVQRDAKGRLRSIEDVGPPDGMPEGEAGKGAKGESFIHVQISEQASDRFERITRGVERVLADVRSAVEDWQAMRTRMAGVIEEIKADPPPLDEEDIEEGTAFLEWMNDDHFTFLGYRDYVFQGQGRKATARVAEDSGLGLLRDAEASVFDGMRNLGTLPPDVQDFVRQPTLLRCIKANRRSTVHRPVHMDAVSVKRFDKKGRVTGEHLFLGLFTSAAYSRSPQGVPLLRSKIQRVVKAAGFAHKSHDGKALLHILEVYPRDELYQISEEELRETALGILHLQERQRIALFVRRDPFERFVSCLVFVPRDRYDTALRLRFQEILAEAYRGTVAAYNTHLTDAALARVHITIETTRGQVPEIDLQDLERRLVEAGRSWSDRLEEALVEHRGEEKGLTAWRHFARAFPSNYQQHFSAQNAVFDIERIEDALNHGLAMNLYRPLEADEHEVRFKIYVPGAPVPLSDILPMLENMGLRVMAEQPYDVRPAAIEPTVWMHDFAMFTEGERRIDIGRVKEAFHDAFGQVWRREMDNDAFNRLVLRAGLSAREIVVLRAYSKYLRQARIPFSQAYMARTLAANPEITRLLVQLFRVRFGNPEGSESAASRDGEARSIADQIVAALEEVVNLDEDRIVRRFLNVIEATLRTNFAQLGADQGPKPYLSFKIDSRAIHQLPDPKPFREIFVYSVRTEGVHLRFGKVARGGLRWSDRREDFRTEVLGLVKAQQVKNAVIVPVGSKGGFVVKNPPAPEAGREAFLDEGIACYRTFIRGLLDITDNLKGGEVVPPERVICRDGPDPYLVVAADKGTATFSDIANDVSAEYGFWLGDAFASGGSAGYDHKKMGITARGAWESVKRHFRELDKDIQAQDFSVVGCGDMSGDVFGNGMLLSEHIKLVGAFNHLHIFVDPDPDPAASWAERKRLFDLPRSAWSDYDAKLISKGGGIFERRAKSIKVSAEMAALFEIEGPQITPNELIAAMLRAKVELLWFGGIGTYVKAGNETHAEVGDRANDAVRIDARQLGAKVVGEGANLGMTQRARIEFAVRGGKVNTDSIDNSAGVDCSDHEVNIKILLGEIEAAGDMTRKQRDELLVRMTDEVADLVLRDNYLQTQTLTVTASVGAHLLDRLTRYMRSLEKADRLDRAIETLPDDETIAELMAQGRGLTRPELSVLMSYAKITLYDQLLASSLPDDPYMAKELARYFPEPLREAYGAEIARHRLRREIVATMVTNDLVNRSGITFVHEVMEKTAGEAADVARAYTIAREVHGLRDLYRRIEALDNRTSASVQSAMLVDCGRLIDRATVWFLRHRAQPLDIMEEVGAFAEGVEDIAAGLTGLLSEDDNKSLAERAAGLLAQGVDAETAQRIAGLPPLAAACDVVAISAASKLPVLEAGRAYFAVGARFGLDWLRQAAGRLPSDSAWDKLAVTAIVDDLYGSQSELTGRILSSGIDGQSPERVVEGWIDSRSSEVNRAERLLSEIRSQAAPDLAMLAVANRQIRSLVAG